MDFFSRVYDHVTLSICILNHFLSSRIMTSLFLLSHARVGFSTSSCLSSSAAV